MSRKNYEQEKKLKILKCKKYLFFMNDVFNEDFESLFYLKPESISFS